MFDIMQTEGTYICNTCGEEIVIPIDITQGTEQHYTEDCPVCCHPNVIEVIVENEEFAQIVSRSE